MQEQHELYENARKRTKQKKRLYLHFVVFIVGSLFMFLLNRVLKVGYEHMTDWFIWAILLWSFFWILHFINVFITKRFMGKEWERKQTEKLVAKQEKRIEKIKKNLEREAQLKAESQFYNEQERKNIPKQTITIIAAIANNYALGKNNDLIWHLPADLKRFKKTTTGHHIIMGRNTYESIGKPLPNRTTVIITRNKNYTAEGCIVVNSITQALEIAKDDESPFIIGGAQIYEHAILIADKLDITEVHHSFDADVFFPEIDKNIWKEISRTSFSSDEKNKYNYSYLSYIRRNVSL